MKVKKYFLAMIVAVLCVLCMPQTTEAGTAKSCGEHCTWSYSNGVLTISGKGEITDNPWNESETIFHDSSYRNLITKVVIKEGITSINAGWAFENCKKLTQVELPNSLKYIDHFAFQGCTALQQITIPKNLTGSGTSCFAGSGLKTVTFAEGIKEIPIDMFHSTKQLKTIHFPKTLKKIGVGAFASCPALEKVTLPWYLEEIETWAFSNCTSLKEITIYQNVKNISDYAFTNSDYSEKKGLTIFGKKNTPAHNFAKKKNYSFKACKIPALKGITYQKGGLNYKVIKDQINGKGTVYVTGINKKRSTVTIPKSVKIESYNYKVVKIGKKAFYKESRISKVNIQSTSISQIGAKAFQGINKNAVITVPKTKLISYRKMLKNAGVTSTMKIK